MFRPRFKSLLLVFAVVSAPSPAARKITIACFDCYSSASLYPAYAAKLAPDVEIEWILVKTHPYPDFFRASLSAFGPAPQLEVNPRNPDEVTKLVELLRAKNASVLGGMCEGSYHAGPIKHQLGLPDHDMRLREARRRKEEMAKTVGAWGIPSHVVRNTEGVLDFAKTFPQPELIFKPNAGAAGIGFESLPKADLRHVTERVGARLSEKIDIFGEEDDLIAQPHIDGDQYYVNTFTRGGTTTITGFWRYHMVSENGMLAYLVDRPQSLHSRLAKNVAPIVSDINQKLGVWNGSSHIEMLRERSTGRWYLLENNVRNAGAGIPALETAIWGISQLELSLLEILDPARLDRELATFPRRKQQDGFLFIVPSAGDGELTAAGIQKVLALPGYLSINPTYVPSPKKVGPTVNLKTAAAIYHFAGSPETIPTAFSRVFELLESEEIVEFSNSSQAAPCAERLSRKPFYDRLRRVAEEIDWRFQP